MSAETTETRIEIACERNEEGLLVMRINHDGEVYGGWSADPSYDKDCVQQACVFVRDALDGVPVVVGYEADWVEGFLAALQRSDERAAERWPGQTVARKLRAKALLGL